MVDVGRSMSAASGSRASSVAPSASQQSMTAAAGPGGRGANNASGSTGKQRIKDVYRPGCSHLQSLTTGDLRTLLRRYCLGIRWGKKVRRGMIHDIEDEDWEHEAAGEVQGHDIAYTNGHRKRRKLLPHPTCSTCQATLHRPYLCLSCAYTGCISPPHSKSIHQGCIGQHLASTPQHDFALDIHSGHLYCAKCQSGVSDPRFDLINQREKARSSLSDDAKSTQARPSSSSSSSSSSKASSTRLADQIQSLSKMPKHSVSTRVPRGIHNLGATCFLSVILQSFIHNPILRNFFLADRHNPELCTSMPSDGCMGCEMDRLFRDFFAHDSEGATLPPTPWVPSSFLYSVWRAQEGSELSQAGQQDSHELFISVLNALHSALTGLGKDPHTRKPEVPRWKSDNDGNDGSQDQQNEGGHSAHGVASHLHHHHHPDLNGYGRSGSDDAVPGFVSRLCDCIVHRTFSGVLQSDVRCLVCGYRSSTHDPVLDLSVDLKPPGGSALWNGSSGLAGALSNGFGDDSDLPDPDVSLGGGHKKKKGLNGSLGKKDRDSTPMKKSLSKQGSGIGLSSGTSSSTKNSKASPAIGDGEGDSQDLLDCLRRYCTSERLPPSSYSCPQCGPVEASKQLSLRRLPPVLCIQLKRFEHSGLVAGNGHKIETKVRFPMRLDVREFVTPCVLEKGQSRGGDEDEDDDDYGYGGQHAQSSSSMEERIAIDQFVYSLFCVIVHEGTLNTGHYWCFCKWKGQWYRLNDAEARPVSVREVAAEKAYQLVYVRDALENVVCS